MEAPAMTEDTADHEPSALERGDVLPEDDANIAVAPEADAVVSDLSSKIDEERAEADREAKKDSRIPASRHKEILEREREKRAELERQLAQYQQGGQRAETNADLASAEADIAKMDAEYDVMITDGEMTKAAEMKQKIRRAERWLNETKADIKIRAAEVRATERSLYSTVLGKLEADYPSLNPDSDDYKPRLMEAVAELKSAYEAKGLNSTQALQKAAKLILSSRDSFDGDDDDDDAPAEKSAGAVRKADAVAKTVKAVSKTPPSLSRSGVDSDKLGGGARDARAVMNMSQNDFAKLTDAQLSKMRGDTL